MKIIKNFLSLAGAEVVSKAFTFVAVAYLARTVGPAGFGQIEFALAVLMCAGLIIDQGLSSYGAREIAKTPEHTAELVTRVVALRFLLAAGGYAAVAAFALAQPSPAARRLILIYGLSLWAMPLLLQWVFQGHDRMHVVALSQVMRQGVFALAVFALIHGPSQILLVAVAEVTAVTVTAAYTVWRYRRDYGGPVLGLPVGLSQLLHEGLPIGLSQMFWVVKMFGATLIIGLFAAAADVGYFASAMRILIAVHTFVWLYFFNLLPSLSRHWARADNVIFRGLLENSTRLVAWAGGALALVWVWSAPVVITRVYGPSFAPSGSTLQWLAGVCVIAGLSGHYRFGLIAAGRQKAEMVCSALGAAAACVLIPLGYRSSGPDGAAAGLVLAEGLVWGGSWFYARRTLGVKGHLPLILRPALAAACAVGAAGLLPMGTWPWRCALAVLIFTALALAVDPVMRAHLRGLALHGLHLLRPAPNRGLDDAPAIKEA